MMIREVQVLDRGTTMLLAQFDSDRIDSWSWKKGPSIRRLQYQIKLGLHDWTGRSEDKPKWWEQ